MIDEFVIFIRKADVQKFLLGGNRLVIHHQSLTRVHGHHFIATSSIFSHHFDCHQFLLLLKGLIFMIFQTPKFALIVLHQLDHNQSFIDLCKTCNQLNPLEEYLSKS